MSLNQMLGGAPESTIGTTLGTVSTGGGGGGSGTGAVAGSDTQVQYNSAGVAGASSGLTFNYTNGTLTTSALVVSNSVSLQGLTTLSSLTVTNNAGVTGTATLGTLTVTNATSMTGALNMNLCNISNVGTETFSTQVFPSTTDFLTINASLSSIAPRITTWIDSAFTSSISSTGTTLNRVTSRDASGIVFNPCGGGTVTYGSATLNGIPIISGIRCNAYLQSATGVSTAAGTKGLFAVLTKTDYSKLTYLHTSAVGGGLNVALQGTVLYVGAAGVRNNIITNAIPSLINNSNVIISAINSYPSLSNVVTVNGSGATLSTSPNGNQQGNNYVSGTGTSTIGASYSDVGDTITVAELIVYDNAEITTTQRQLIEGYLAWKWGLSSQLPSTHPYVSVAPYGNSQTASFGSMSINAGSNVQISATSNIVLAPGAGRNVTVSGNLIFPTVNVFTVSGTSLTLTTASAGSYYNLINSGFSSLSLPSPVPTMAGTFWTLRNATSSYLSVTVANNGTLATPLILTPSNNTTIVVSVSGVNGATISGYILF